MPLRHHTGGGREEYYEVDAILAWRGRGKQKQYLVRWSGYPDSQASWEPADSFSNSSAIIDLNTTPNTTMAKSKSGKSPVAKSPRSRTPRKQQPASSTKKPRARSESRSRPAKKRSPSKSKKTPSRSRSRGRGASEKKQSSAPQSINSKQTRKYTRKSRDIDDHTSTTTAAHNRQADTTPLMRQRIHQAVCSNYSGKYANLLPNTRSANGARGGGGNARAPSASPLGIASAKLRRIPWLKRISAVVFDRRRLPYWVFGLIIIALLLLILFGGLSVKHMISTIQKRITLLTAHLQFPSTPTTPH